MTWRKIVIEFPDDTLDPEQEVAFLTEHYKHSSGVPTATVTLQDDGNPAEPPPPLPSTGLQGTVQSLGMTVAKGTPVAASRTPWPGPVGRAPTSVTKGADELVARTPFSKREAVKAMMGAYGIKYALAVSYIEEAWKRKP